MASHEIGRNGYDVAVAGTGFASSFFLLRYLEHAPADARVLVLERGRRNSHDWQIKHRTNSDIDPHRAFQPGGDPHKTWNFVIGFGGGSNCWWGNSPRMLPADFELKSRCGVGDDWPLSYDELASHYRQAEEIMAVAGPDDAWPFPRDGAYPQPPHRFNGPERLLKQAYPNAFFANPAARPRIPTATRPSCCASGVCNLCPVDAKFTVANTLMHVYDDPRVTLVLDAEVLAVETAGGTASGVVYRHGGAEQAARADLVVLGANALFNAVILLRSNLPHKLLGRRLHEQVGLLAEVFLDGVDSFQGSTSVTGHGYMLYDDDARRREKAACLIETWNIGLLRTEHGRWRQVLPLRLVFEDLPQERNRVELNPDDPARPLAIFEGYSDYLLRAVRDVHGDLERVLAPLPIERIVVEPEVEPSESHIQGTTVMGSDPASSVVDRHCLHHDVRNLLVLGSSVFPTCAPANPTLTICALSLRAADHLMAA